MAPIATDGAGTPGALRSAWQTLLAVVRYALIALLVLIVLIPIGWMVSSSFMLNTEFFAVPIHWLPEHANPASYGRLILAQPFLRYYLNSIIIAVAVAVSNVFFSTLTGFALSNKYSYAGKNAIFFFVLGTMLLPFELIMIPLYIVMRTLGLLNTYAAVIIPGMIGAFGVFLLRQAINEIPNELLDAGRIDGAPEFGLFWRIVAPLSAPVMAALLIFTFVGAWNSYFWPLVVINDERLRTLTLAVAYMQGYYSTDYSLVMAAAVVSSVPIMIVFAFSQRFFIRSMTLTGLKG